MTKVFQNLIMSEELPDKYESNPVGKIISGLNKC